jgi:hypothetical protein
MIATAAATSYPPASQMIVILGAIVGVLSIVLTQRQWNRRTPLRNVASTETPVFICPVHAARRTRMGTTHLVNGFGDIELRIHQTVLVVELPGAFQRIGRRMGAEIVLSISTTVMWPEHTRSGGLGAPAKDCIILAGEDAGQDTNVTLDPLGHFDDVWNALRRAGVTVVNPP